MPPAPDAVGGEVVVEEPESDAELLVETPPELEVGDFPPFVCRTDVEDILWKCQLASKNIAPHNSRRTRCIGGCWCA